MKMEHLQRLLPEEMGRSGKIITPNARAFSNIPLTIAYKGQLIIRGEAVITYTDFERINEEIGDDR